MFKFLAPCASLLSVWLYCQTGDVVMLISAFIALASLFPLWYLPEYDSAGNVIPETFKHW